MISIIRPSLRFLGSISYGVSFAKQIFLVSLFRDLSSLCMENGQASKLLDLSIIYSRHTGTTMDRVEVTIEDYF